MTARCEAEAPRKRGLFLFVSCLGAQIGLMSNRVPRVNSPLLTKRLQFRVLLGEAKIFSKCGVFGLTRKLPRATLRRAISDLCVILDPHQQSRPRSALRPCWRCLGLSASDFRRPGGQERSRVKLLTPRKSRPSPLHGAVSGALIKYARAVSFFRCRRRLVVCLLATSSSGQQPPAKAPEAQKNQQPGGPVHLMRARTRVPASKSRLRLGQERGHAALDHRSAATPRRANVP